MEKVIIAVDAGGSTTKVAIINSEKEILKTYIEGCGSPAVLSNEKEAFHNIYLGLKKAYNFCEDKWNVVALIIGVSGFEVVKDIKSYEDYFYSQFHTNIILEKDTVLAVYSIITDKYDEGVLVLSGTGSAVMGIKKDKTVMIGGWGQLLTEVGSAYTTVRDFFISMIRNYESGNGITPLGRKFLDLHSFTEVKQLKFLVYPHTKKSIASHSKFIADEAKNGDPEAIALIKKGARDLANDVRNAFRALNLSYNTVIGFRGGFILNVPILQEELILALQEFNINCQVVEGDQDPIYGAYYLAKRKGYLC